VENRPAPKSGDPADPAIEEGAGEEGDEEEEVWDIPKNTPDRRAADSAAQAYSDFCLYDSKTAKAHQPYRRFNHSYGFKRADPKTEQEKAVERYDDVDWYLNKSKNSKRRGYEHQIKLKGEEKSRHGNEKKGNGEYYSREIQMDIDSYQAKIKEMDHVNYTGSQGRMPLHKRDEMFCEYHYPRPKVQDQDQATPNFVYDPVEDQEWAIRGSRNSAKLRVLDLPHVETKAEKAKRLAREARDAEREKEDRLKAESEAARQERLTNFKRLLAEAEGKRAPPTADGAESPDGIKSPPQSPPKKLNPEVEALNGKLFQLEEAMKELPGGFAKDTLKAKAAEVEAAILLIHAGTGA